MHKINGFSIKKNLIKFFGKKLILIFQKDVLMLIRLTIVINKLLNEYTIITVFYIKRRFFLPTCLKYVDNNVLSHKLRNNK